MPSPDKKHKYLFKHCLRDLVRNDYEYRSISGAGNNQEHPEWGQANQALLRIAPADYGNGKSSLRHGPNPREISNELCHQSHSRPNSRKATAFFWLWGQFLDHDLDLSPGSKESAPIHVPKGDPDFDPHNTGKVKIAFDRSAIVPGTGTSKDNPREQLTNITSYLDGSNIYGSNEDRAKYVRLYKDGKLKVSDDKYGPLAPKNDGSQEIANPTGKAFFVCGDDRANEHIGLTSLHILFIREHNFGANMVALDGGRPQVMNLKDLLTVFIAFRESVVSRRTKFLLGKARDRAHILVGLAIAVANIDEVIRVIRTSPDPNTARETLMARDWPARDMATMITLIDDPRHRIAEDGTARLSLEQAKAILDLRLQRLTALGREEITEELNKLATEIADYLDILRSRARIQSIIKDELTAVKDEFATPRRTQIIDQEGEVEDEDLIQREDMVVTVSHAGYVKRVPLSTYRAQKRGGKGRSGMQTRDEDFVSRLFIASTHTPVLFFSSRGQVYKEKVWRLPMAAPNSRGKALINILPLEQGERITTIMPLPEDESSWSNLDVMFATTGGNVRRNKLSDFVDVRRSGIIAMKLDEGEAIVDVQIATENDDVLLTAAGGQCIRFPVTDVRVFSGRTSMGVRGIALGDGDKLISLTILRHLEASSDERAAYLKMRRAVAGEAAAEESGDSDAEETSATVQLSQERYAQMSAAEQFVLTISENGYGKRSSSFEYRTTGRGGKGIVAMSVNNRNGKLVASFPVEDSDQIMLVTDKGQLIRCPVEGIRVAGRSTQGVIVFDTAEDEHVVSVEHISEDESENGNGG